MTPLRARLSVLAVIAIVLATAANLAIFQKRVRNEPDTSVAISVTRFPVKSETPEVPLRSGGLPVASPPTVPDAPTGGLRPQDGDDRLTPALERELKRKGYLESLPEERGIVRDRLFKSKLLAFEYDNGLPLTGTPTAALLKRLVFDLNGAPRGILADRAEMDRKLVSEVQKTLLELGFFSGVLSGRMDIWTANAVKAFQTHRAIAPTARLDEVTLIELISYSGETLLKN